MNNIYKTSMGTFDMHFGYRFHNLEGTEMFDFVQHIKRNMFNHWNKKEILTDVVISRCELQEVLDYLKVSKEELKNVLDGGLNEPYALIDAIESADKKSIISFGYTWKNRFVKQNIDPNNYIYFFKDKVDYSNLFNGLRPYQDKAVEKVYEMLKSENYPLNPKDQEGFEKALKDNLDYLEEQSEK